MKIIRDRKSVLFQKIIYIKYQGAEIMKKVLVFK
jgi:hypothetical protein